MFLLDVSTQQLFTVGLYSKHQRSAPHQDNARAHKAQSLQACNATGGMDGLMGKEQGAQREKWAGGKVCVEGI